MGVLSPAFCGFDSPARESGRLEGTAVGLCCSGPIDPSPIDNCRMGYFWRAQCHLHCSQTPNHWSFLQQPCKVGQGQSHPCTQVQMHHARMYLEEWVIRHIHALHAVGFQGVVGYLNLKVSLLLPHLFPPLQVGLVSNPPMVKFDPTLLPILLSCHQSVHSFDSP